MKTITASLFLMLALFACNNEQPTCACVDPNAIDSIANYSLVNDSVYTDVLDEITSYPKVKAEYQSVKIEHVVQVSCGYPKFSIRSNYDTLIISAQMDSGKSCVDWTAKFKYAASVTISGTCRYVRFKNSNEIYRRNLDTLLKF